MGHTNVGRLILKSIPNNDSETAVIRYLGKLYKNASPEKLKRLVKKRPAILGKNVPEKTASLLIANLKKLGATAVYTPVMKEKTQKKSTPKTRPSSLSLKEIILDAFQEKLPSTPVPFLYRMGLFFVAILMVVLPLIYIALIGAAGYLTYRHAIDNLNLFATADFRLALLGYIGPVIVGSLVILFMIKPLFAREALALGRSVISPQREPLLFDFVEKICDVVGAPVPKKVYFNTEVNAFAGLRRGLLSIFGRDLELTIGLPMMAGLNLKQFTGVLAHEFGHFSQTTGMGFSYVIRSISYWLHRVVYEEDEWDFRLRQWSQQIDIRIGIILYVARLLIWLTRRVLWCLMIIGQGVSCFLLRQMEYDADRYEIGLVGSTCFETTANRFVELSFAYQMTLDNLFEMWEEGRLADNMPALVLLNEQQIPRKELTDVAEKHVAESATGLLDTHPCDRDRILQAQKLDAKGLFSMDPSHPAIVKAMTSAREKEPSESVETSPPATILMNDFDGVSKATSFHYYRALLGDFVTRKNLVEIDTIVKDQNDEQECFDSLDRFFVGLFDVHRPVIGIPVMDLDPPANTEEAIKKIRAARDEIRPGRSQYESALKMYSKAYERAAIISQAQAIIEAGITINGKDFGLASGDASSAATAYQNAVERKRELVETMKPLEDQLRDRIEWSLRLLSHPTLASHFESAEDMKARALQYLSVANRLEDQFHNLDELYHRFSQLMGLTAQLEFYGSDEALVEAAKIGTRRLQQALKEMRYNLSSARYPFEHTEPDITVGDYAIVYIPGEEDLGPMLEAAQDGLNRIMKLYTRLAGRLTTTAETVEKALGLGPLK